MKSEKYRAAWEAHIKELWKLAQTAEQLEEITAIQARLREIMEENAND